MLPLQSPSADPPMHTLYWWSTPDCTVERNPVCEKLEGIISHVDALTIHRSTAPVRFRLVHFQRYHYSFFRRPQIKILSSLDTNRQFLLPFLPPVCFPPNIPPIVRSSAALEQQYSGRVARTSAALTWKGFEEKRKITPAPLEVCSVIPFFVNSPLLVESDFSSNLNNSAAVLYQGP